MRRDVQGEDQVQSYAATLVSLAALGADDARFVIQLPAQGLNDAREHQRDELHSASRLHVAKNGSDRVVLVDALQSLSDAKVQCAISPGAATAAALTVGVPMLRAHCMLL